MSETIPYPTTVVCFLLVNQFSERFTFYGIRTILSLYLNEELKYSDDDTTIIYHIFAMLVFTFPIIGAIIADTCLGKFKTIFYISLIYIIGDAVLTASAINTLELPQREFAVLGLVLIAIGTGGIKPCVAAFGGDQFVLPQQERERESYYHLFYFAINIGSLCSIFLTPMLRKHIYCFNKQSCYSIAFGLCTMVMLCAVIVLVMGKPFYKMTDPQGNMMLKILQCIGTALNQKRKSKGVKKEHWLDFASDKYGQKLVNESKIVLKVLYMYLPLPLFWALFEQMATGWTFQARRMKGEIGNFFTILPDQMQIFNPILVLMIIPLINYVVYPALNAINLLTTPLQKIATGGILTSVAFVVTAFLEIAIEDTLPVLPITTYSGQIRIFNILPCEIELECSAFGTGNKVKIPSLRFFQNTSLAIANADTYSYTITSDCSSASGEFKVFEKTSVAYFFNEKNKEAKSIEENIEKSNSGNPKIRVLVNLNDVFEKDINITFITQHGHDVLKLNSSDTKINEIIPDTYNLIFDKLGKQTEKFALGGVYTIGVIAKNSKEFNVNSMVVTQPNSICILWMVPQYILISLGECLLSITGIEFSYSQAPISMKSVLQAAWLLTSAVGQLLVVLISFFLTFSKVSSMFFLYAAIMAVDMIIFTVMSLSYVYVVEAGE